MRLDLHADPVGGTYIWRWDTAFSAAGSAAGRRFAQSTLESARFAPDVLRRRSMDFTPKLAAAGEAEAWVLQRMDGTRSLQQLAEAAAAQFPELFLNTQEATELVCRLSEKFST